MPRDDRMIRIDQIVFPYELVESIDKGELVVFVGSGVSMDEPTNLPNFGGLIREIENCYHKKKLDYEAPEVFFGSLKSEGYKINEKVAEIISESTKPNKCHKSIINLFKKANDIRIVTTNYDKMLEVAAKEADIETTVYNAPALPLGNDFRGIVHLHGSIDEPKYMVVTDDDFGRAYLSDAYSARFLVSLFNSFDVLFIGYSCKDVTFNYLTKAMSRDSKHRKYVLTSDDNNWKSLGIETISIYQNDFDKMYKELNNLSEKIKKDLFDWKQRFTEFKATLPNDVVFDGDIDFCLKNNERARIMSNIVTGEEWLVKLSEKGVFDNLFSDNDLTEFDEIWAEWLVDNCLDNSRKGFETLYLDHNYQINRKLIRLILNKIVRDCENINKETFDMVLTYFGEYISQEHVIYVLLNYFVDKKYNQLAFRIFPFLFKHKIVPERMFLDETKLSYKCSFYTNSSTAWNLWEKTKETIVSNFSYDVPKLIYSLINDICDKHKMLCGSRDLFDMIYSNLEDRNGFCGDNHFALMSEIFCECIDHLESDDKLSAQSYLFTGLKSDIEFINKIAIKALRRARSFTSDEKFQLIIDNIDIFSSAIKQEFFLFLKDTFNELDKNVREQLIKKIQKEYKNDKSGKYEIYNICVWINTECGGDEETQEIEQKMKDDFGFDPRKHPELDVEIGKVSYDIEECGYKEEDILSLNTQQLINIMLNIDDNKKVSFKELIAKCASTHFNWVYERINEIYSILTSASDIWECIFRGLEKSNYMPQEIIVLVKNFNNNIGRIEDIPSLSRYIYEVVKDDKNRVLIKKNDNVFLAILKSIILNRKDDRIFVNDLLQSSFNTILGTSLLTFIRMLWLNNSNIIEKKYYSFLSEIDRTLKDEKDKSLFTFIIGGHLNLFVLKDSEWYTGKFADCICGNNNLYDSIWGGISTFSRTLHVNAIDKLIPIYEKSITKFNSLSPSVRCSYIELYSHLMFYCSDNQRNLLINKYYKFSSDDNIHLLIESIVDILDNLDGDKIKNHWNTWLKNLVKVQNEKNHLQLNSREKKAIIDLSLKLDDNFDECVDFIVDNSNAPTEVSDMYFYDLSKKQFDQKYPESVCRLLIYILVHGTRIDFQESSIEKIYKTIKDLISNDELRNLNNALLKRNLKID